MQYCKLGSILLLTILSACVSTTGVNSPAQIGTNSTFQVIVTAQVDDSVSYEHYGFMSVLVPDGWDVDNMSFSGPNSGEMSFIEWGIPEYPEFDEWMSFESDTCHSSNLGDIYSITMSVYASDTLGTFDIAFLAWSTEYMGIPVWNGDPCSTIVEVVELNLEHITWGNVKTLF